MPPRHTQINTRDQKNGSVCARSKVSKLGVWAENEQRFPYRDIILSHCGQTGTGGQNGPKQMLLLFSAELRDKLNADMVGRDGVKK